MTELVDEINFAFDKDGARRISQISGTVISLFYGKLGGGSKCNICLENQGVHDMVCLENWGRLKSAEELHFATYSREGWEF